ncbi:MAG TPA: response regulator transcription factor [Burkholderiales bacterium]|nr:response regulator transcription factor [Burkholderiales bacterium]
MIQVLVADDHGVVRDGVRRLLEGSDGIKVVAVACDGRGAVAECSKRSPDVVVMDVSMPEMDGVEATRAIVSQTPAAGVVILSMHSHEDVILRALDAGARGYLLKESAGEEVVAAVRAVAAGGRYFGHGVVAAEDRPGCAGVEKARLTETERAIVRLLAEGRTNAEAAQQLGLSTRTVETYRGRLMQKLAIEDFSSLVKFAIRSGIARLE